MRKSAAVLLRVIIVVRTGQLDAFLTGMHQVTKIQESNSSSVG